MGAADSLRAQSADSQSRASLSLQRLVVGSVSVEKQQPHHWEDQDEPADLAFQSERPQTGDFNIFT